jgi:hypothetical protein
MILIKEGDAVHTSQKLKRSLEDDLHLTSLLNPKLLPEFRLGATSSNTKEAPTLLGRTRNLRLDLVHTKKLDAAITHTNTNEYN